MSENQTYQIFDTPDEQPELRVKLTSNKNIREVCEVFCKSPHKTSEERMYYAEQGEIEPDVIEDGTAEWKSDGAFAPHYPTVGIFWAGIAENLFYNCPQILEFDKDKGKHGQYVVANEKLFESLVRSEVQDAWEFFLESFGAKPYEVASFLGLLPDDLIGSLQVEEMVEQMAGDMPKNMNASTSDGETES